MFRRDSRRGGLKGVAHERELQSGISGKTTTTPEEIQIVWQGLEETVDGDHPSVVLVVDPWEMVTLAYMDLSEGSWIGQDSNGEIFYSQLHSKLHLTDNAC